VLRNVVDVDHRRPDVGVAHERLHLGERERPHRDRPEGVAEVVEADVWQGRAVERLLEAPSQSRVLDVVANVVDEHAILVGRPAIAPAQLVERAGCLVDQRNRPDLLPLQFVQG
jgi:hypothetical protein